MRNYTITLWMDNDVTDTKEHMKVRFTTPDYVDLDGLKKTIKEKLDLAREDDCDFSYDPYRFFDWMCNTQMDGWQFEIEPEESAWQFDFDNNDTFDTDSYYGDF